MPLHLSGHCALRHLDLIYVIGSDFLYSDYIQVLVFNITAEYWQILPQTQQENRPQNRQDFACSISKNKTEIFISGGNGQNDFWKFDLMSGSWQKLANSIQKRAGHVMTLYRNHITVIGGVCPENQTLLGSMESFIDGAWITLNETITRRKNFKVTQVPSSFL